MSAGEKEFFHLYSLAPSLKGHEILVASSNNKAVENVSRELPAIKAVGRPLEELSYFRSVSDLVHGPRDAASADEEDGSVVPDPVDTWGLVAAVLGNRKNRAAFQQSFWWHDDRGFRLYLKAAKGDPVVREIKDPNTGKIVERRTPSVVLSEKPPSPEAAKGNWRRAKEKFLTLKREIDAELKALEGVRQLCLRHAETRRNLADSEAELHQLRAQQPQAETHRTNRQAQVLDAKKTSDQRLGELARHLDIRPGLVSRLFRTERWKEWSRSHAPLAQAVSQAGVALQAAERAFAEAVAALDALTSEIRSANERLAVTHQKFTELSCEVDTHRRVLGDRLVDEQFFAKGHETSNLTSPWIADSIHRKREDLLDLDAETSSKPLRSRGTRAKPRELTITWSQKFGTIPNEARQTLFGCVGRCPTFYRLLFERQGRSGCG